MCLSCFLRVFVQLPEDGPQQQGRHIAEAAVSDQHPHDAQVEPHPRDEHAYPPPAPPISARSAASGAGSPPPAAGHFSCDCARCFHTGPSAEKRRSSPWPPIAGRTPPSPSTKRRRSAGPHTGRTRTEPPRPAESATPAWLFSSFRPRPGRIAGPCGRPPRR